MYTAWVNRETLTNPDPRIFRLARQHLDGASFDWIAERWDMSAAEVREAWNRCRELLTQHLRGVDEPLMSDSDIFERSEDCVRLLLRWQETYELSTRLDDSLSRASASVEE